MTKDTPIRTAHLFSPLESRLIELLDSLSADEWQKQALPQWTVKDIAAHLLDTSLRRPSMVRDGYIGEKFHGSSYQELVEFLNRLNADWVKAFRRVSPAVLTRMIENASQTMIEHIEALDPFSPSPLPVSWAGEAESLNWFDIAREYTERWHHQQQIREAVHRPGIMGREFYAPVLETFVRVLPHTYRDVNATAGTVLRFEITGEAGGVWYLRREDKWSLTRETVNPPQAEVLVPDTVAWKLFTKALNPHEFAEKVAFRGSEQLGRQIQNAVAVMM